MSAKTKIVVIRKKDLLLGAAAAVLLLVLILLLVTLFTGEKAAPASMELHTARYQPGIYTSTITINDTAMDVEVALDENHINSIRLVNLDETAEAMVPLAAPAMEELSSQILRSQSAENVTYPQSNPYTSMVLHRAILNALSKGERK